MWLLHAMSGRKGARCFHLRGYGPRLDELRCDVRALMDADCISCVLWANDGQRLAATFTQRGNAWLEAWRRETVDSIDERTSALWEVAGESEERPKRGARLE